MSADALVVLDRIEDAINEHPGEDISAAWQPLLWDAYADYHSTRKVVRQGTLQRFEEAAYVLQYPAMTALVAEVVGTPSTGRET